MDSDTRNQFKTARIAIGIISCSTSVIVLAFIATAFLLDRTFLSPLPIRLVTLSFLGNLVLTVSSVQYNFTTSDPKLTSVQCGITQVGVSIGSQIDYASTMCLCVFLFVSLSWPMKEFNKSKAVHYAFLTVPFVLALLMAILNGTSYAYLPASKVCMTTNDSINLFATVLTSFEIVMNGVAVLGTLIQFSGPKASSRVADTMSKLSVRLIMYPIITVICTFLASLINPNIPFIAANNTYTASALILMGNILKLSGGIWNFLAFFVLDLSCHQICGKISQKIAAIPQADRKPWHRFGLVLVTVVSSVHINSWMGSTLKGSSKGTGNQSSGKKNSPSEVQKGKVEA